MSTVAYSREKIAAALQVLAVHPGPIKARLRACAEHFFLSSRRDMPTEETRAWWDRAYKGLALTTETGDPIPGSLPRAIERLTDEEAVEVAQAILNLDAFFSIPDTD
jgi:hypothetical protein